MLRAMLAAIIILAATVGGCASNVIVYGPDGTTKLSGIPVRSTEVFVKKGKHNKLAAGGACDTVEFAEVLTLPTGPRYYLAVDAAQLTKTGFSVKLNEAGVLTQLDLNTEPAAADTLRAVGDLYKALVPVKTQTTQSTRDQEPASTNPPCDAGETDVSITKFEEFYKPSTFPRPSTAK
jgi:hypothetical protein